MLLNQDFGTYSSFGMELAASKQETEEAEYIKIMNKENLLK